MYVHITLTDAKIASRLESYISRCYLPTAGFDLKARASDHLNILYREDGDPQGSMLHCPEKEPDRRLSGESRGAHNMADSFKLGFQYVLHIGAGLERGIGRGRNDVVLVPHSP